MGQPQGPAQDADRLAGEWAKRHQRRGPDRASTSAWCSRLADRSETAKASAPEEGGGREYDFIIAGIPRSPKGRTPRIERVRVLPR